MRLGDVVEFQNGYAFKSSSFIFGGDHKIIKIKEIKDGRIIYFNDSASINAEASFEKYEIHYDDVVFALTGDPVNKPNPLSWVGRVARYNRWEPAYINQRVCFMRSKDNKIVNPLYVYYYFRQFAVLYQLASIAKGSASQANISTKDIENVDIILPPIDEQNAIVSILNNIDQKILTNELINENLHQQYVLLVDHLLSELTEFEMLPLSEVAECQNGRAFYKEGYDDAGAFVIDLGNVNTSGNYVYTNADKYISLDRYNDPKLERYRVYQNDLVMVMTDRKSTMELLGKTGKIYKPGYYLLNQRMYRIRAKLGINTNYLYACLNSTEVCDSLKEMALGSVQKYINTGDINSIQIKVPASDKMKEIGNFLDPIFLQMETNILENESLIEMRNNLLPRLMSGDLEISNIDI